MREYKFRAWDKTAKKWHTRVHVGSECCSSVYDEERQMWLEFDEICGEIVQWTGLKDKNGKEIYEGDIFKAPHDFGPGGFDVRQAVVWWHETQGYQWNYWLVDQLEVIGNIYENAELLEVSP